MSDHEGMAHKRFSDERSVAHHLFVGAELGGLDDEHPQAVSVIPEVS